MALLEGEFGLLTLSEKTGEDDNKGDKVQPRQQQTTDLGLCMVCSEVESKYRCPRCSVWYCSVGCYRNHSDGCRQSFERERLSAHLRSMGKRKDPKDIAAVKEIIHRVDQEDREHGSVLASSLIADAKGQSGDPSKKLFEADMEDHIECWDPWWREGRMPDWRVHQGRDFHVSSSIEQSIPSTLPSLRSIRARPPHRLVYPMMMCRCLFGYVYSLLRCNGDWFRDQDISEFALDCIISLFDHKDNHRCDTSQNSFIRECQSVLNDFNDHSDSEIMEILVQVCVRDLNQRVSELSECSMRGSIIRDTVSVVLSETSLIMSLGCDEIESISVITKKHNDGCVIKEEKEQSSSLIQQIIPEAEPVLFALCHIDSLIEECIDGLGNSQPKNKKHRRSRLKRRLLSLQKKIRGFKSGWNYWCREHGPTLKPLFLQSFYKQLSKYSPSVTPLITEVSE